MGLSITFCRRTIDGVRSQHSWGSGATSPGVLTTNTSGGTRVSAQDIFISMLQPLYFHFDHSLHGEWGKGEGLGEEKIQIRRDCK